MQSSKKLVMLGLFIGSAVGSYIPALWGGSLFSYTSLFLGGVGGIAGIYIAYKLSS